MYFYFDEIKLGSRHLGSLVDRSHPVLVGPQRRLVRPGGVLGASVVLVGLLVDPRGSTGATLNLVDLSTDLLDAAGVFMDSGDVTGIPMGFTCFFFRLTGFACFFLFFDCHDGQESCLCSVRLIS